MYIVYKNRFKCNIALLLIVCVSQGEIKKPDKCVELLNGKMMSSKRNSSEWNNQCYVYTTLKVARVLPHCFILTYFSFFHFIYDRT